jgi:NAD-dependent SIR2 family protein deacetylase
MPITLEQFAREIKPANAVLFFGAGSSVPSGCPTAKVLVERLINKFSLGTPSMGLSELAGFIELKTRNRREIIELLRSSFNGKRPTGGLLTVPFFEWKSIYTTNYDELIELAYKQRGKELQPFASNFDFNGDVQPSAQKLYKIHGTISKDRSDGHQSSLILTDQDYADARQHRDFIYDRLATDVAENQLVIVGYSLADPEIKELIARVAAAHAKLNSGRKVFILVFERDLDRAEILEEKNYRVAFGGIDDLLGELIKNGVPSVEVSADSSNPLDAAPALIPSTIDVIHSLSTDNANVSVMFSGRPATYSDISTGLTFERDIVTVARDLIVTGEKLSILLLGASGVGKSTAARQVLLRLRSDAGYFWEHRGDNTLDAREWTKVAIRLSELGQRGVLLIDDAHMHLQQLGELADALSIADNRSLVLVLAAPRNRWNPRIKSPLLLKTNKEFRMSQLSQSEIDRLLNLAESVHPIRQLVESTFAGFSRLERRRRLVDRCEADTFVCLKNIFASEGFDDIVLAEFSSLDDASRGVYRVVAFLETCGVTVHRQLLVRLLGIPSANISAVLVGLMDIVFETQIDPREGIYVWRGRHAVISEIVAKYKFSEQGEFIKMLERVIQAINPTFAIELRSVRELCSIDSGIASIKERGEQNRLLRMIISVAPGERVPRHRLIRNLISAGEYEKAATEIRIFENDFGVDGPVAKYHVSLMLGRAKNSPGLLLEDRQVILDEAVSRAARFAARFSLNKSVLAIYCEAGLEYFRLNGDPSVFDEALDLLKKSVDKIGDPDLHRLIANFEGRLRAQVETDMPLSDAVINVEGWKQGPESTPGGK